jgi:hypothetical protein
MAAKSLVLLSALLLGCTAARSEHTCKTGLAASAISESPAAGVRTPRPPRRVSARFGQRWRDGKAEISGYRVTTMRYGEPREGTSALIYVTEPMSRRTWIKDDHARGDDRVEVLKLNHTLNFRTGIYPYSVMTSVFSPVESEGREPFTPAKISLSVQEWCGHVYHQIYPKGDHFHSVIHSYFASEGDRAETVQTEEHPLYEDALLIQLRELDGPFLGGKTSWSGTLVPSLWSTRKAHHPLKPVRARLNRKQTTLDGAPVTRFTLERAGVRWTYDVERAPPRRVLAWSSTDGERGTLLKTARLPYWKLNGPGGEAYLEQVGLKP